jgi:hypothetical protein
MISCDLFGGLGNNLFQLATAYNIHKKYGYDLVLPSTADRGNIGVYGQSTTLEFNILFDNEFKYNDHLSSQLPKYIHTDHVPPSETDFSYTEIPAKDNICYHGYFQSHRYFQDVDIPNEFIISKDLTNVIKFKYDEFFIKKNISIHLRLGGDRVTDQMQHFHKNVSVDFYKKAMSLIDDYNENDYNILVFSDRMDDAKEILKSLPYKFNYINNNNILDFIFMSLCDVNIVSNSTFSWWAAYMNKIPNKKVIVTESEWFGPGYKHFNLKDTFPESWIRL